MSMKDALKDAGLNSTKTENMRDSAKGRDRKQSEKHQHTRNFCEVCELIMPDVERFKHKNPTVDAEWICIGCADKNNIMDDTRMTHQSDFAKQSKYRREFGATKDKSEFDERGLLLRTGGPSHSNNRNNRNNSNNKKRFDKKRPAHGERSAGGRGPKRHSDNQGRRPNPNRGNSKPAPAKYTIDENGEKNFNC